MRLDDKLVHEALQRWARTSDGRVFYVALQKVLMGVTSNTEAGALQENLGRRRFAAELMAVMAEGMTEADKLDAGSRPIVFELAGPVAVSSARGTRRRISPEPVASDDAGPDKSGT